MKKKTQNRKAASAGPKGIYQLDLYKSKAQSSVIGDSRQKALEHYNTL